LQARTFLQQYAAAAHQEALGSLQPVLDLWTHVLLARPQQQQPPAGSEQLSRAAGQLLLLEPACVQQYPRVHVWSGLKALMAWLQDAVPQLLSACPALLPAVLTQSTPAAYTLPVRPQPGAAAAAASGLPPPGMVLAPEGSMEQKHALACLSTLLSARQQGACAAVAQCGVAPDQLLQHLHDSCWAAVRRSDTHGLTLLLQALAALVAACLPCLPAPDAGWGDGADEEAAAEERGMRQHDAAAMLGAACRAVVQQCLQLLLIKLPCSQAVPLLIRGIALEVSLVLKGLQQWLIACATACTVAWVAR
jgi:hypothetical protein